MSLWPSTIIILISNWPRTRKFSQLFKNAWRENRCFSLFSGQSRFGHAPRPIFMPWLVKIWQVSSCGKFIQHLETCLLQQLTEADRVLCQLVMFLITVFFHWMYKMKYSCYQESSVNVIHGWFLYWIFVEKCAACQSRKSDFGWHRFCFSPCWMCKRFRPYLIAFRSCISKYGKPELSLYLYLFSWSPAQFMRLVYARLYLDLRHWSDLVWGLKAYRTLKSH